MFLAERLICLTSLSIAGSYLVLKVSVKMLQSVDRDVYFSSGSASNYSEFVGCVRFV